MPETRSQPNAPDGAYERIEQAVAQSDRGRRFLVEFAQRARKAETQVLLQAIARLEANIAGHRDDTAGTGLRADLARMVRTIDHARSDLAATLPHDADAPHDPFHAAVAASEGHALNLHAAAEAVQDAAWHLREAPPRADLCEVLERQAAGLYAAALFQEAALGRMRRLCETIHDLERCLATALNREDAPEGPSLGDLDRLSVEEKLALFG